MAYIIKRTDQGGGYVAKPGSAKSYTHNLEHARKFDTREQAEADRCKGNEVVLNLEQVLNRFRG